MSSIPDPAPDMLAAALQYAEEGIPVFPLHEPAGVDGGCTCAGGEPCRANPPSPGKHPRTRRGVHDASTDPEQITKWWRRWPTANIGGAMGERAGVWVADVDGPDGEVSLAARPPLPVTRTARTGRPEGGRHLFWAMPDAPVGNRAHVLPGLDVRGTGGYVVLPPSLHPSGARYAFEDDSPVLPAPPWLLDLVIKRPRGARAQPAQPAQDVAGSLWSGPVSADTAAIRVLGMVRAACMRIRAAPEGARNDTVNRECFSLGGFLDAAGVSVDDVAADLESAARDAEQDPRQVRRQLEDGRREPRALPPDAPNREQHTPLPDDTTDRPRVLLGPRVDLVLAAAAGTLRRASTLYARAGAVVAVDAAVIAPIDADRLVPQMSALADYGRMKVDGKSDPPKVRFAPEPPPYPVAKQILARGAHPELRALEGVTRSPVLRPDGSVVTTPGYDADTRVVYVPSGPTPVLPASPTLNHARSAIALIYDVLDEVPFARSSDRAAALSLGITLACRHTIRGPAPCFASLANQARTGKTQLVQMIAYIALGSWVGTTAWPVDHGGGPDEAEQRKRIDSAVMAGSPLILWDNIRGPVAGGSIEASITSTTWECRPLGRSESLTIPQWTVHALSANGGQLAGDMPGRTLPMRLFWDQPHPELRTFRRPNLRGYVESNRGQLHAALLTIASAYLRSGAVEPLSPWGSFEAWSALPRSAVVWAGEPDPVSARDGLGAMDASGSAHDRMLAFIAAVLPKEWRAGELADALEWGNTAEPHEIAVGSGWTARDARDLAAELGVWDPRAGCVLRKRLGLDVRNAVGRPASDGRRIEAARGADGAPRVHRTKVPLYRLEGGSG